MPLYEYHCLGCDKVFEILQKFSDPIKKKCEECGGKLEKLVSSSSFHLKGTGWYKTDYASKPALKDDKAKPSDKKEAKKEKTKKEAKAG